MKLAAIVQIHNEVANGNLERCLSSLVNYCDVIQIYDDGSTDEPHDLYTKYHCDVIWGLSNDFKNELAHKQLQLERCKELEVDWVWRIDADEVIEACGEEWMMRELIKEPYHNSWAFHMVNLWRDPSYYRIDNSYNDVIFNRLWRLTPDLHFDVREGLHLTNYPVGATEGEGMSPLQVIHWGFASDAAILAKFSMYKREGQSGPALTRLIDETSLRVMPSNPHWFKSGLVKRPLNDVFKFPLQTLVHDA